MRAALVSFLSEERGLEIVGQARDGVEAVQKARALTPDVITMDVSMPRLDGLGATAAIMAESPSRILVVCHMSDDRDVDLSFRAMQAGALEVLAKPGPGPDELRRFGGRVVEAVRLMAEVPVVRRSQPASSTSLKAHPARTSAIGLVASTGGPPALTTILRALPKDLSAPILIAQHIASGFMPGLLRWLRDVSPARVQLARSGDLPAPGTVYLPPDGCDLEVDARGLLHTPRPSGIHVPSGNRLLQSLANVYGPSSLGVVLTGMGDDGAQGLLAIRNAFGATYAQDEASCVVFGMPSAARALGATDTLVPLELIGPLLVSACARGIQKIQ
jgi:two-component system chemotaxis response regulator CheB